MWYRLTINSYTLYKSPTHHTFLPPSADLNLRRWLNTKVKNSASNGDPSSSEISSCSISSPFISSNSSCIVLRASPHLAQNEHFLKTQNCSVPSPQPRRNSTVFTCHCVKTQWQIFYVGLSFSKKFFDTFWELYFLSYRLVRYIGNGGRQLCLPPFLFWRRMYSRNKLYSVSCNISHELIVLAHNVRQSGGGDCAAAQRQLKEWKNEMFILI